MCSTMLHSFVALVLVLVAAIKITPSNASAANWGHSAHIADLTTSDLLRRLASPHECSATQWQSPSSSDDDISQQHNSPQLVNPQRVQSPALPALLVRLGDIISIEGTLITPSTTIREGIRDDSAQGGAGPFYEIEIVSDYGGIGKTLTLQQPSRSFSWVSQIDAEALFPPSFTSASLEEREQIEERLTFRLRCLRQKCVVKFYTCVARRKGAATNDKMPDLPRGEANHPFDRDGFWNEAGAPRLRRLEGAPDLTDSISISGESASPEAEREAVQLGQKAEPWDEADSEDEGTSVSVPDNLPPPPALNELPLNELPLDLLDGNREADLRASAFASDDTLVDRLDQDSRLGLNNLGYSSDLMAGPGAPRAGDWLRGGAGREDTFGGLLVLSDDRISPVKGKTSFAASALFAALMTLMLLIVMLLLVLSILRCLELRRQGKEEVRSGDAAGVVSIAAVSETKQSMKPFDKVVFTETTPDALSADYYDTRSSATSSALQGGKAGRDAPK